MCYSYSNTLMASTYRTRFRLEKLDTTLLREMYYVSAFSLPKIPVITNERPKELQFFTWGLIPGWTKSSADAEKIRFQTMNARAESIFVKPSYRHAARAGRCLIPADGFYEWHTEGKTKQPYYITLKEKCPFAFAGLWDTWVDKATGEELKTCAIITTEASPLLAKIHNTKKRMPVILHPKDEAAWLDANTPVDRLKALLSPYGDKDLEAWPVPGWISRRGIDPNVPEAQKPLEEQTALKL